jgi:hypothetical protein
MGLIDIIKRDVAEITGNSDQFGVPIILTNGTETANLIGTTASHFLKVDPETGLPMRGRNVHVSVSMTALTDEDYPFRNGNGEVALVGHRATVQSVTLVVREVWPDETFGLIVIVLGDYV